MKSRQSILEKIEVDSASRISTGERSIAGEGDAAADHLLALTSCLPCGVALFDAQDRAVLLNDSAAQAFGLERAAVPAGISLVDLLALVARVSPGEPHAAPSELARLAAIAASRRRWSKQDFSRDVRLGGDRIVRLAVKRTGAGGRLCLITDVTDQRQTAEKIAALQAVADSANRLTGEFLANMSHELRTPLNAIIGFSEALTNQIFGPLGHQSYREFAADIVESGNHLLGLINDIMDVAKLEAGQLTLNDEPVDLGDVVRKSVRATPVPPGKAGLAIDIRIPPDIPLAVVDERRLTQALQKLLSNSVKFTPAEGRIVVAIAVGSNGDTTVSVEDTGIGMHHGEIAKALRPFIQLDASLSGSREGIGLGLAISKGIIELHGGTMALSSSVDQGTIVSLVVPKHRVIQPQRMIA